MNYSAEMDERLWNDGYTAYERGYTEHANPFPKGTNQHYSWWCGWLSAEEYEHPCH